MEICIRYQGMTQTEAKQLLQSIKEQGILMAQRTADDMECNADDAELVRRIIHADPYEEQALDAIEQASHYLSK